MVINYSLNPEKTSSRYRGDDMKKAKNQSMTIKPLTFMSRTFKGVQKNLYEKLMRQKIRLEWQINEWIIRTIRSWLLKCRWENLQGMETLRKLLYLKNLHFEFFTEFTKIIKNLKTLKIFRNHKSVQPFFKSLTHKTLFQSAINFTIIQLFQLETNNSNRKLNWEKFFSDDCQHRVYVWRVSGHE